MGRRGLRPRRSDYARVMPSDDDEDWVGEPPEGRYTRDRAKPEFWRSKWPVTPAAVGLLIVIVVVVIVFLAR